MTVDSRQQRTDDVCRDNWEDDRWREDVARRLRRSLEDALDNPLMKRTIAEQDRSGRRHRRSSPSSSDDEERRSRKDDDLRRLLSRHTEELSKIRKGMETIASGMEESRKMEELWKIEGRAERSRREMSGHTLTMLMAQNHTRPDARYIIFHPATHWHADFLLKCSEGETLYGKATAPLLHSLERICSTGDELTKAIQSIRAVSPDTTICILFPAVAQYSSPVLIDIPRHARPIILHGEKTDTEAYILLTMDSTFSGDRLQSAEPSFPATYSEYGRKEVQAEELLKSLNGLLKAETVACGAKGPGWWKFWETHKCECPKTWAMLEGRCVAILQKLESNGYLSSATRETLLSAYQREQAEWRLRIREGFMMTSATIPLSSFVMSVHAACLRLTAQAIPTDQLFHDNLPFYTSLSRQYENMLVWIKVPEVPLARHILHELYELPCQCGEALWI